MNTYLVYGIIFVILLVLELVYFKIADRFNIIDKPNRWSCESREQTRLALCRVVTEEDNSQ